MRKLFGVLLFTFLSVVGINNVSAAPIMDDLYNFGTFEIAWHDYDDRLGYRPDEITLNFGDLINVKHEYEVTFKKDDVKVTRVDDETTIWSVTIPGIYMDRVDGAQIYYTENANSSLPHYAYPNGGNDYMTKENKKITVDFYILPFRTITYTEHWDDDGARDSERLTELEMKNSDIKRYYRLSCARDKETYIDENTCSKEIYIEDAYPLDENGNPDLSNPYKFDYEIISKFFNYNYEVKVDKEGNIDVYVTHDPYKIADSKVTINWNDHNNRNNKRPDTLVLDLYNHDKKEQSITVTKDDDWSKVITNLYKNYLHGKASDYSLKISNTDDYEFTITGNVTDGFVIDAKYIGEEIMKVPDVNDKTFVQDNFSVKNTDNPKTSDNIIYFIIMLIVSTLGIIISLKINKSEI